MYVYILLFIYNLLNLSYFNEWSSLRQTFMKIKHNREMVGKICRNMKLTSSCTPLPKCI